jgi:hypothetical protein
MWNGIIPIFLGISIIIYYGKISKYTERPKFLVIIVGLLAIIFGFKTLLQL